MWGAKAHRIFYMATPPSMNDATLFMRADRMEAAWRLLMPVLEIWSESPPDDFPNYAAGTWGPEAVQGLLFEGHSWPLPTELLKHDKNKRKNKRQKNRE